MRLTIYQDKARGWRWRFVGRNGRLVAIGGESFTRRSDAVRSARRVADAMHKAAFYTGPKTPRAP
jgi:uncharacterized protein YegP (UPF0339 family)